MTEFNKKVLKSKTEAEHFLKENDASVEDCMNLLVGICFYLNGLEEKSGMTDKERSNLGVQISYLQGYAKGIIDRG